MKKPIKLLNYMYTWYCTNCALYKKALSSKKLKEEKCESCGAMVPYIKKTTGWDDG